MICLVTGASGFIGQNLTRTLSARAGMEILAYDIENTTQELEAFAAQADFIFHLAGVNRPQDPADFMRGNADLTATLIDILKQAGRATPLLVSSSVQAGLDNPYGQSKRAAEDLVFAYGRETGAPVYVYRLPGVFGKWCRPNYNSVVATFCHNIANGLPIQVNDPAYRLPLVYVDDVVEAFIGKITAYAQQGGLPDFESAVAMFMGTVLGDFAAGDTFCAVPVVYETSLGELAATIESFRDGRSTLATPHVGDALTAKLYATYLSYLPPEEGFAYPLKMNEDARGSFTEFLRTPERGQVSVNVSHPGIVKGEHWHHTKNEKFLVVAGAGVIRFRKIGETQVYEYPVSGDNLTVVDIAPGYTHNIENTGAGDMVTIMWASECFDPLRPDTYYEKV